eukprot:GCRY01003915.1.p1 GENE.GCRY01003915.1~~GCRY01003915.1.p1  ORF type:complete len:287 (+),score=71.30 GCRY01003915.1:206-1066(+)
MMSHIVQKELFRPEKVGKKGEKSKAKYDLLQAKDTAMHFIPVDAQTTFFRHFFHSNVCNLFLRSSVLYFGVKLRISLSPLSKTELKALQVDADQFFKEMSLFYSQILFQYSQSQKSLQDRLFFETVYNFTAHVVFLAYDRKHWGLISEELGHCFRTHHFNINARANTASEPKKEPTLRERVEMGMAAEKPTFNRKRLSIKEIMNARSPLIDALLKDDALSQQLVTNPAFHTPAGASDEASSPSNSISPMDNGNGGSGFDVAEQLFKGYEDAFAKYVEAPIVLAENV